MKPFSFSTLLPFVLFIALSLQAADRGEVGTHGDQFIWTGTGQAFVPNFIMIDSLSSDLTQITSDNLDAFIQEFLVEHGFNGIHVPVCGQWFHSGQTRVTQADEYPDPKTFDTLALILEKVYDAEETLHGLWHHTLAGGVAAIWGNRVGNGKYPNKEAIKCFSVFWNDHHRYRLNMEVDPEKSDGFSLYEPGRLQVFYKENTDSIRFYIADQDKKIIAVDTRKAYQEILIGTKPMGWHLFSAPYRSDWALAAE